MKDDRVYLLHIRDSVQRIFQYTAAGKAVFFSETIIQDAVIRNLEIVGEAVKNISDKIRLSYPEVPWKQIAGMRDKIIHEYFGVNLDLVWDAVEKDLPSLAEKVETILKSSG